MIRCAWEHSGPPTLGAPTLGSMHGAPGAHALYRPVHTCTDYVHIWYLHSMAHVGTPAHAQIQRPPLPRDLPFLRSAAVPTPPLEAPKTERICLKGIAPAGTLAHSPAVIWSLLIKSAETRLAPKLSPCPTPGQRCVSMGKAKTILFCQWIPIQLIFLETLDSIAA